MFWLKFFVENYIMMRNIIVTQLNRFEIHPVSNTPQNQMNEKSKKMNSGGR